MTSIYEQIYDPKVITNAMLTDQKTVDSQEINQKPWYDNLGNTLSGAMQNWGGYAKLLAPGATALGQTLVKGSGASNTMGNAVVDLAQGLASGKIGGNLTSAKTPTPTTAAPVDSKVSNPFKVSITGDLNGDGVVNYEDFKISIQNQVNAQSNIKQADSEAQKAKGTSYPGLSSGLSQGPRSFSYDSEANTGNSESILNAPVGNATDEERSNMLMYLGGILGPETALKMSNDTANLDINRQKADSDRLTAQASNMSALTAMQKANTEYNKYIFETSPAYVKLQGDIEEAKKMGDKKSELWLTNQLIENARGSKITDPFLRQFADNYGELMVRSGNTKVDGIISSIIGARARVQAANLTAGATVAAANTMSAAQIDTSLRGELNTLNAEKSTLSREIYNRESGIIIGATPEENKARLNNLYQQLNSVNNKISDKEGALNLIRSSGRAPISAPVQNTPLRTTISIGGKSISGVMSSDGKTFTGDNGKVYRNKDK